MLELELAGITTEFKTKKQRQEEMKENFNILKVKDERHWLLSRGKYEFLNFSDQEIKKLKDCFNSLDGDRSGAIGVKELEDPLIGLGFAENREEVADLIKQVDDDGSGFIEFSEFLCIIKNADTKSNLNFF